MYLPPTLDHIGTFFFDLGSLLGDDGGAPIQCDGRWWSGASLRTGIITWYVALNAESEIPMRPGCFGSRRCRTQMPLEVRRSISRVVSSLYWIDLSKLPVL